MTRDITRPLATPASAVLRNLLSVPGRAAGHLPGLRGQCAAQAGCTENRWPMAPFEPSAPLYSAPNKERQYHWGLTADGEAQSFAFESPGTESTDSTSHRIQECR